MFVLGVTGGIGCGKSSVCSILRDRGIRVLDADEISKAADPNAVIAEKAAEYDKLQTSVQSAAARGYVDAIIEPADTRKYVIGAFEMLFTKREDRPAKKHGTV